ncbi:MAG: DUF2142 domain-containing protein [Elusimicrobia bacterium]|nr:DUF2142 domain-containing protein [Elusimicrobiota bacterium]
MKLLRPENAFLFIAVTFGMMMVFVTPPFQTPDEPAHFYRAYQISGLKMISKKQNGKVGDYLPESLHITTVKTMDDIHFKPHNKVKFSEILPAFKIPLSSGNKTFIEFPNMARYCPAAYIPQSVGIAIGRLLRLSPLVLMYMGRICNLAVWVLLVYLAIKITPVSNWLFFILALTPMSLFVSSSLSADVPLNAASFLFIAICLQYAFEENKTVKPSDIFILFLLSIFLSLTKLIYLFIPLIFLIIPVKKIGTPKKYYTIFTLLILSCAFLTGGWYLVIKNLVVPLKPDIFVDKQIAYVLHNPLKFLEVVIKSLSSARYIDHFVGRLGWLDTKMSLIFTVPYFLIIITVALIDTKKDIVITLKQRIILFITLSINLVLICLSQYLTWTPVGKTRVYGLQGRYFIPVALLLFLLFYPNKKIPFNMDKNRTKIFIICYSLICSIYTILVLIRRYYLG